MARKTKKNQKKKTRKKKEKKRRRTACAVSKLEARLAAGSTLASSVHRLTKWAT
jgi:hypothetical protein